MTDNEYATMQTVMIHKKPFFDRCIIDIDPPSFWLECNGERWRTEWHPWFGPIHLDAETESPLSDQPDEKSMFWRVAVWWKNQGAKVVDGIGQWKYPPREKLRYRKIGHRSAVIVDADDNGPDVIEEDGEYIDNWTGEETANAR